MTDKQEQMTMPQREPHWQSARIPQLPDHPPIMLVYDGLLGFCYEEEEGCEIGYLRTAPTHQPRLDVVAVTGGKAESLLQLKWKREEPPFAEMELEINALAEGVSFFMPYENKEGDPRDFRWLIDLEEFHSHQEIEKQPNGFLPRLILNQGVFHTLLLTEEEYTAYREDDTDTRKLGRIAHLTAASFACHPRDGILTLTLAEGSDPFEWPVAGRRLFVIVQNHCEQPDGSPCVESDKRDTDFDLYYDALQPSSYEKKYRVICDVTPSVPDLGSLDSDLIEALELVGYLRKTKDKDGQVGPLSTNEAPCGRAGFGQSCTLTEEGC